MISAELVKPGPVRRVRTGVAVDGSVSLAEGSFPDALVRLGRDLASAAEGDDETAAVPLVLFFDQFEEFFLNAGRDHAGNARAFVRDVAEIDERSDAGVHLVFSMREEFLAEMDVFRDEIPEIFHADSNLRLRWFTRDAARSAIVEPVDNRIEPTLTDALLDDLAEIGRMMPGVDPSTAIEPAQLQIVCHTVWRESGGGPMTIDTYRRLGAAAAILERRLVEELGKLETAPDLELAGRLLPELATEHGTKWVREANELARTLGTDIDSLRRLLRELEHSGLVNVVTRETSEFVEFVHDYLADPRRIAALQTGLRLVRPRRFLREALARGTTLGSDELRELRETADELALTAPEGELLVRSALLHGDEAEEFIAPAQRAGADPWRALREAARAGSDVEAEAAIEAASRVRTPEAIDVLRLGLIRDDIAPRTVQLLGEQGSLEAADVLGALLSRRDARARGERRTCATRPVVDPR